MTLHIERFLKLSQTSNYIEKNKDTFLLYYINIRFSTITKDTTNKVKRQIADIWGNTFKMQTKE